ncbi:succinate dehydrogenase assembly factor 2 [Paracoccus sp. 11-3]|uniref:FAD assembly factor SdhE n=1 Tax=Paracoccus amoyensis TaxID=2760093 RepID=A0A926G8Q0_9RHOB|nr:succinate dehydrogenase assembly factor 2 [Paracoccus amoyensis]MBC9245346.1 succinate dehydrogenase assembly factor 2 [Paracoccus amoyensis]
MDNVTETHDTRIRRLKLRSWRRGMKEMDLILGHFADGPLTDLSSSQLDEYEAMMNENDQDLYLWVTARVNGGPNRGPEAIAPILDIVASYAGKRLRSAG